MYYVEPTLAGPLLEGSAGSDKEVHKDRHYSRNKRGQSDY